MAFDFINRAIDKIVGAGKATKDAVVKADADYNNFMNTKVAPKAAKVGGAIITPIKEAAENIGTFASKQSGFITGEEAQKRYDKNAYDTAKAINE